MKLPSEWLIAIMENIYKPIEFFCTDLLDAEKHFDHFSKLVLETNVGARSLKENVTHLLGDIKHGTISDLQNACRYVYTFIWFKINQHIISLIGFSIDKLKCDKEVQPVEQPDTILSQHRLVLTNPVTSTSKQKLRTIEIRDTFKDEPKEYAKYRHQVRHEFETNIMVRNSNLSLIINVGTHWQVTT